MRIHFICKRYYTNKDLIDDKFGRLYHLPVELARLGAKVSVNAVDYKNTSGKEIDNDRVLLRSIPVVPIKLFFLPFSLYRNASEINPDIIIASGDSYIGFMAMLIARKLKAHFVFDVYDFYPAFLGNKIPGMKMMFRRAVKGANLVFCASESLMQKLLPFNTNQLLVENGVDLKLFAPSDLSVARKELGLKPELQILGYFGSVTRDRGPLLIEACRILRDDYPLLHLLLAGNVSEVDLNEPWITYLGERPQVELPRMINSCDLLIIPYANSLFNNMSGACKISEYLACGKPVVVTRVSNHEEIFEDVPNSLCEPTVTSMVESIRKQIEKPEILAFDKRWTWNEIGGETYKQLQKLVDIKCEQTNN